MQSSTGRSYRVRCTPARRMLAAGDGADRMPRQFPDDQIWADRHALLRGGANRVRGAELGQRVTAAEVHNNPLTKVYLCQTIGYNSRLKGSCAGYGPGSYGRGR